MSDTHIIIGIHIDDRLKKAVDVQKVFSDYGSNIKTRVGLHDAAANICSPSGVVLIEFLGSSAKATEMMDKLATVEGVQVQRMTFGN